MKKNLNTRFEECKNLVCVKETDGVYAKSEEERFSRLDFSALFKNGNPVCLEIGCGRGKFAVETAAKTPGENFLAVEKISNVLVLALERAKPRNLTNLLFLNCDAANLLYYIPENSVARIYLNFSCPFPKSGYKNQRLTNSRFIEIYKKILVPYGEIRLKTDSADFFDYSLSELKQAGFNVTALTRDLHAENPDPCDVVTEYEENFIKQGKPVYRFVSVFSQK